MDSGTGLRESLLSGAGLAFLVVLLWGGFGLNVGPDTDVWNIHANPELYPWLSPSVLRPFLFTTYRLSSFLFPDSFVGYNLLVAVFVFGKGLAMYSLLSRLLPRRFAFAFLTAALFTIHPAGVFNFRANMVAYHFSVLCYLLAANLLVAFWQRSSFYSLAGMVLALSAAVGTYETVLPLVFATPILLVWMEKRLSRRFVYTSLIWYVIPVLSMSYLGHAVSTGAATASYQSSRLSVDLENLGEQVGESLVHVYRNAFWEGYRKGIEHLGSTAADGRPTFDTHVAAVAVAWVGLVGWILYRRGDRVAGKATLRQWASATLGSLAAVYVGYVAYFPTELRFETYRTLVFASLGASATVMFLLDLLSGSRKAVFVVSASFLVGIAMLSALRNLREWDAYSRDEQAFVVELAGTVRAVKSNTLILVAETKQARFKHRFHVWFYQNALRLIHSDKTLHVCLCYDDVAPDDLEHPSCRFTREGAEIRNPIGLAKSSWPYEQIILLEYQESGELVLRDRVPAPRKWSKSYKPRFLFSSAGPLPRRLHTFLKYAPEPARGFTQ